MAVGPRQDTSCIRKCQRATKSTSGDGCNNACFATSGLMSTNGWHAATNPRHAFDRILLSCRAPAPLSAATCSRPAANHAGGRRELWAVTHLGDMCPMWRALRTMDGERVSGCSRGTSGRKLCDAEHVVVAQARLVAGSGRRRLETHDAGTAARGVDCRAVWWCVRAREQRHGQIGESM